MTTRSGTHRAAGQRSWLTRVMWCVVVVGLFGLPGVAAATPLLSGSSGARPKAGVTQASASAADSPVVIKDYSPPPSGGSPTDSPTITDEPTDPPPFTLPPTTSQDPQGTSQPPTSPPPTGEASVPDVGNAGGPVDPGNGGDAPAGVAPGGSDADQADGNAADPGPGAGDAGVGDVPVSPTPGSNPVATGDTSRGGGGSGGGTFTADASTSGGTPTGTATGPTSDPTGPSPLAEPGEAAGLGSTALLSSVVGLGMVGALLSFLITRRRAR